MSDVQFRKRNVIVDPVGVNQMTVNEDGSINTTQQPGTVADVELKGLVDDNNSTSISLGIDEVFTGKACEILNYGMVFVNIISNVASAPDGLSVQQSSDGTNWDHSDDYTIPAGTGKNYSLNPHSKYYRVVYTNGGTAQTYFRLQSIIKGYSKDSSHRIKDEISGDDDCTLVKAAITGENGNGQWHNVKTTADGNLTISDNSSGLSIAQGNVTGTTFVHKFGNAPDFDQSDGFVTCWDGAEDGTAWELMNYVYSTTADIDSISSDNIADTQNVVVEGVDSNWELTTQTVTLNGQTRVALQTPLLRCFRAYNDNSVNLAGHVFVYVNGATTGGIPNNNADIRAILTLLTSKQKWRCTQFQLEKLDI
jgi:hypothetical protein